MQREQWPTNQSKIRIQNHISTHSTTQQPLNSFTHKNKDYIKPQNYP